MFLCKNVTFLILLLNCFLTVHRHTAVCAQLYSDSYCKWLDVAHNVFSPAATVDSYDKNISVQKLLLDEESDVDF